MTQKIVNVSEIDGLKIRGSASCKNQEGVMETDEWISKDDLRALLDKSPSVSGEFVYQCAVRGNWMDTSLANYIKHTGVKRKLCTTPQPDRVAELEAKLKVASEALEKVVEHDDSAYYVCENIAKEALAKIKD